jgi:hypothetical protein
MRRIPPSVGMKAQWEEGERIDLQLLDIIIDGGVEIVCWRFEVKLDPLAHTYTVRTLNSYLRKIRLALEIQEYSYSIKSGNVCTDNSELKGRR